MGGLRNTHSPGRALWVDEFGNTACGGVTGYSNTFAASFYYLNALGRAPDPGGKAWWTSQLDTGLLSRAGAVMAFADCAELRAASQSWIEGGIVFA